MEGSESLFKLGAVSTPSITFKIENVRMENVYTTKSIIDFTESLSQIRYELTMRNISLDKVMTGRAVL